LQIQLNNFPIKILKHQETQTNNKNSVNNNDNSGNINDNSGNINDNSVINK